MADEGCEKCAAAGRERRGAKYRVDEFTASRSSKDTWREGIEADVTGEASANPNATGSVGGSVEHERSHRDEIEVTNEWQCHNSKCSMGIKNLEDKLNDASIELEDVGETKAWSDIDTGKLRDAEKCIKEHKQQMDHERSLSEGLSAETKGAWEEVRENVERYRDELEAAKQRTKLRSKAQDANRKLPRMKQNENYGIANTIDKHREDISGMLSESESIDWGQSFDSSHTRSNTR